jgi:DNA (cytosine-5)-methyltransferase 1
MSPAFRTSRESVVRIERVHERLFKSQVENHADPALEGEAAWWQSILRGARIEGPEKTCKLNVVDAFCGAGGFALGLRFAADVMGTDVRFNAVVDTDAGALQVHAANLDAKTVLHDSVRSLVDYQLRGDDEDIRFAYPPEIVAPLLRRLPPTDVLIAGPPCQGHSNLNNHSRRRDPRNDHFLTAVAFGMALGARAILIENVPTVQNAHGDVVRVAEILLRNAGYDVSVAVLRAERLGAAQARARFFMVAVAADPMADATAVDWLRHFAAAREASPQPVTWAIGELVDRKPDSIFDSAPQPSETNRRRIAWLLENDAHDLPWDERPDCHRNGTSYTAVYGRMYRDRPAPTITTGFGAPGQGRFIHPDRPRLITPHEAARIQGFPDWFDFAPGGLPYTRKNLAKWIGDAVPPNLGFTVALAMLQRLAVPGVLERGAAC